MLSDTAAIYRDFARSLGQVAANDWRARARPAQIPPAAFTVYLLLAGRGFGKSWCAANYTCEQAQTGAARRIALVAPTWDHARFTMVEGASGILAVAPPWCRPQFEPSKSQLVWPNGTLATIYSADTPESLRGPEHDFAWCDELASFRRPDTWDNLLLTLRVGEPRIIATTTPKPVRLIRDLVARDGQDGILVRRGTTYENREHLSAAFFSQLVRKYEGTRTGRQELLGELLTDTQGAFWTYDLIEATRVASAPANLARVVVGVDPSGSGSAQADECGIVVAAIDGSKPPHAFVLADVSGHMSPNEWAQAAVTAFRSFRADRIVVEQNFGGQMCESVLRNVDASLPIKNIVSSRGKALRAEPVASLWEQKRGHLAGMFPGLEDELTSFTKDWNRARDGSPGRLDAMCFAIAELTEATSSYAQWEQYELERASREQEAEEDPIQPPPQLPNRAAPRPKAPTLEVNPAMVAYAKGLELGASIRRHDRGRACATCREPVIGAMIDDGYHVWHPGCYRRDTTH